jgi:rRNA-processing protein FCF1
VIAHKEFVEKLCRPDTSAIYPIGRENICCFTIPNEKESDAYLLSNLTNIQIDKSKSETVLPKINTECEEIFTTAKPTLTSPKIIGTIDISPFEKKNKTYIIDTNMFLDCPDIIQKIDKKDNIVLSAKVIDELDSLKVKLPDKLNEINTAFRIINRNMEGRKIMMEPADLKLLPDDFNKKSPDNFILSVALKCKDNNPILLTSDNGLQVKAKGVKIKTKSLVEFIKSSKK